MTFPTPPPNLKSLEQRIRNLEADDTASLRRQVTMAMVVVGQMLPEGAVKGGTCTRGANGLNSYGEPNMLLS